MAFVKIQKSNTYFSRFQTKFRRRREGKTDYYARKRLVTQDKDKYNTAKYRFVVRLTSGKVICQVIYQTLTCDRVMAAADSTELKRYGLTAGLTNYSSAYCTGLLLARRLLKQTGLDNLYKGNDKVDGADYDVNENANDEKRPFKAVLDVGLQRTTTGKRIFGALKGACDGGLHIPHSTRRFPGYVKEGDTDQYNPKVHRDRIFGVHVDNYMKELREEGDEDYQKQFSQWDKCLKANKIDTVEKLYTKIHADIKKNPERVKKAVNQKPKRDHAKYRLKKLNAVERKKKVAKKFEIAMKKAAKAKK